MSLEQALGDGGRGFGFFFVCHGKGRLCDGLDGMGLAHNAWHGNVLVSTARIFPLMITPSCMRDGCLLAQDPSKYRANSRQSIHIETIRASKQVMYYVTMIQTNQLLQSECATELGLSLNVIT